jgi:diguanylate cyclase (GGDEF)-like protein
MTGDHVHTVTPEELAPAIEAASISYEEAIRAGRSQDAERIALASLAEGVPVAVLYEQVLAPAMTRIGALWATGEMTIADEHLASAFNFKVMASVYSVSLAHRPTANRGRVLLAGVEGDRHGVGLRMAGDVLDLSGCEVLFLGENVSARDLVRAAAARRPDVIAIAIPTEAARSVGEATLRELESCCPEIPVLVGGRGMPLHSSGRVRALTSKLTELVPSVAQLIPPGREEEVATSWPGMDQVPLSVRATNVAATPEDRLLDIAAEAAETARAHARVAHAYRRLAHEDPLTGAPNRRAFDDRINELLEDEVEASLILIDLDGFKQVNDLCGHAAGDKVLQRVAKLIADGIPSDGFAARFGGDEFAVLLPHATPAGAQALASSVLAALKEDLAEKGVTATAGIAPLAGDRRQSLINADLSLYQAKAGGGDRIESHTQFASS